MGLCSFSNLRPSLRFLNLDNLLALESKALSIYTTRYIELKVIRVILPGYMVTKFQGS